MKLSPELTFASHVVDLIKSAEGTHEKHLPWYTAAGMGLGGQQLATRLAPGKFKGIAGAAGLLAGTGAGVHVGENVGRLMDKRAEELVQPNYDDTLKRIAKRQTGTTLKEIGAIAIPTALGMGAGFGLQKYLQSTGRSAAPAANKILAMSALPAAGMAAGALYRSAQHLKENELAKIRQEEMDRYNADLQAYEGSLKREPQP